MKKFMIIMRGNQGSFVELSEAQQAAVIAAHQAWAGQLGRSGRLLAGDGFDAETVMLSQRAGALKTEQHPFVDSDDALSGYYLVQAADLDDAVSLATGCPALQFGESVEVVPLSQHG